MINNIELIFREQMEERLKPLRDAGAKIYSISRLNNIRTCPRQYFLTYLAKEQQKPGVYGILGTACHSDLEDLYESKEPGVQLVPKHFNAEWNKCNLFGVNFPSAAIAANYKKDIDMFYKSYKKMDGEFISELGFILQIDEMHYLMGYIDLLQMHEDGTISIYDFKTSAMFKDKKLIEAGRQLCIYQMALEQLYGLECVSNQWIMLKYLEIQVGSNKPKVVSAREAVEKCESQIKTLFKKKGYIEESAHMYLTLAKKNNDFSVLPSDILADIKVDIHIKQYDVTDEVKAETMEYINSTIKLIEDTIQEEGTLHAENWECNVNKFFCENLCGFYPKHCQMG